MIVVWKEPELSGPVVVRPDGKITVPLVNEIYVVGLTPLQLQNLLMEKLKPLVNAAQVTVTVRDIKSYKVYLIGQVARQGEFQINNSTTVFQVIAEAGGLGEFAKRKKIYVLRNVNGKQVRYPFNYDEVIQERMSSKTLGCGVEIPLSCLRLLHWRVDMNCRTFLHLAVSRVLLATTLAIVSLPLSRVQLFAQESGSDSATVGQQTSSSNPNSGQRLVLTPNKAVWLNVEPEAATEKPCRSTSRRGRRCEASFRRYDGDIYRCFL